MNPHTRTGGIRALERTAVVAIGIAVAPNGIMADPTDEDNLAPTGEKRAGASTVAQRQASTAKKTRPSRPDTTDWLPSDTLAELPGLDRTYLLCLAATSPVDALRLAAARALARPLHAVGERTAIGHLLQDPVPEVRAEAERASALRGI